MSTKITYEDKVAIQNDENIPEKNKVTDENMNEIKKVVNENADELDATKEIAQQAKNTAEGIIPYDDTKIRQDIESIKDNQATQDKNIENLKEKNEELDVKIDSTKEELERHISNIPQYDDSEVKEEINNLKNNDTSLNNQIIELTDKTGNKLKLDIDTVKYIMTLQLLNEKEEVLDTKTIDFPLESVVVNGKYQNGNIILTLQSGTEITIPIGDIVNGLISQETFDEAVNTINNKIQEINTKLNEIDKEQQTQNTDIENLKKENIELREENKSLRNDLNNLIPPVKGEGEDITLEGTAEATFKKLEVGGNSWQETRSGKNKFNVNNLSNNYVSNIDFDSSSFTVSNTFGTPICENKEIIKMLNPSTKYKCVAYFTLLEKPNVEDLSPNNVSAGNKLLTLYNSGKNTSVNVLINDINSREEWELNKTKRLETSFTTPDDLTEFRLLSYCYYTIDGNPAGSFKLENMMITLDGDNTELFEPYGSMPSPEFISPIRNCGDDVNLIPFDDLEETIKHGLTYSIKKGIITLNGTATDNFDIFGKDFELNDDVYTINRTTQGNYSKASAISNGGFIIQKKNENSYIEKEGLYFNISDINTKKTTSFEKGIYRPRIYIDRGNVYENFVIKPKLEKGTKATPWSPYGCGSVNFKIGNKNLYDKDNPNILNTALDNNGLGSNMPTSYKTVYIKCKSNTTYTISKLFDETKNRITVGCSEKEPYYNMPFSEINGMKINNNDNKVTLTTNDTAKYLIAYVWATGGSMTSEEILNSVQIEEGSTATDYQPHQEQSISFPTKEGQVFHKDDYLADDGTHHVRNTIKIDSNNFLFFITNEKLCFIQKKEDTYFYKSIKGFCTHFKNANSNEASDNNSANRILKEFEFCFRTEVPDRVYFKNSNFINLEDWTNFFDNNEVFLEYELVEPIIEPFSEEQKEAHDEIMKLKSYGEVTHIFSDDEIKPIIKAEAFADISKLLNPTPVQTQDKPLTDEPSMEGPQMEDPEIEQPQIESPGIESTEEGGVESE